MNEYVTLRSNNGVFTSHTTAKLHDAEILTYLRSRRASGVALIEHVLNRMTDVYGFSVMRKNNYRSITLRRVK